MGDTVNHANEVTESLNCGKAVILCHEHEKLEIAERLCLTDGGRRLRIGSRVTGWYDRLPWGPRRYSVMITAEVPATKRTVAIVLP